uniref:NADH-ubiquinone oxidoreductase chain 5 n=3 Tax=Daphnia TaxID=6668 RepID=Q2F223_DAPPU|nr:NADH dehydrogenase subunit 5 [Daphnia pulex]
MTVDKYLYQKISFFLVNLMFIAGFTGVFLSSEGTSIFFEWFLGGSSVNFSMIFLLDSMSCFFLAVVLCISGNVVWYSKSYMALDPNANRFILLVLGFVASMAILILSPNILSILLGWDGLGLISYGLVIYYPSKKSSSAGMITVLSNRVGDVCILLSIAWFVSVGDFNFSIWAFYNNVEFSNWVPLLVLLAAMTKSAQIPFSAWLPAAMAAPTPVSALVHSSTLVTAGVYLLIRFSFILGETCSALLLFISIMTMFMSGVVAIFEYDLKKIIALSTLSQLGMMMFSISLGLYELAFFHLLTHALFKALLFLCAGILIHGAGNTQDIRSFGGLSLNFPLVTVCMNLANLSLCGVPFLAGFYSKDLIVELACQYSWGIFVLLMMFICLSLTVLYSVRLTYLSFVGPCGGGTSISVCESDYSLVGPVVILSFTSLVSGPILSWLNFPAPVLIFLPVFLKWGALFFVGVSLLVMLSLQGLTYSYKWGAVSKFSGLMWFLPWLTGQGFSMKTLKNADHLLKIYDQGWLEFYSSKGLEVVGGKVNTLNLKFQHSSLKLHFLIFLLWLFLCFIYIL